MARLLVAVDAQAERHTQELREQALAVNAGFSGKIKEVFPDKAEAYDPSQKWW